MLAPNRRIKRPELQPNKPLERKAKGKQGKKKGKSEGTPNGDTCTAPSRRFQRPEFQCRKPLEREKKAKKRNGTKMEPEEKK